MVMILTINFEYGHHVTYLGMTGSGKTVGMQYLYSQIPRAVVYDIEDYDHWETIHNKTIVTRSPEQLAKLLNVVRTNNVPEIHIVYKPRDTLLNEELVNDFNTVCGIIFQSSVMALLCDELGYATGLQPMDSTAPPHFENLLIKGRKRGLSMIGASQRNQLIPKIMITQSRHLFCYRLTGYDLRLYAPWINGIGKVEKIPKYYCMYQFDGNTEILTPVPMTVKQNQEVIYYE